MAWYRTPRSTIFVIVRLDAGIHGEAGVTVKEAVCDEDTAAAEVQRLNLLNADRGAHYFYQATRLFPPGYSAGSSPPDVDPQPPRPAT